MLKRTITAIVAVLFFFPFVIYGGWPLSIVMLLIGSIGLIELLRMRKLTTYKVPVALAILLLWILLLPESFITDVLSISVNKIDLLFTICITVLSYTVLLKNKFTFDDAGFLILGTLYIGLGFHYFIASREIGLEYVFFAIVVILITDTGAYFSGSLFGKHKLLPEISPKKTIEGAVGGALMAIIAGTVFNFIFPVHDSWIVVMVVSFLASLIGQTGDLVESGLKRHYSVKDSGRLLPGHGGILDRFDSWLFVFPFLHLIQFIG